MTNNTPPPADHSRLFNDPAELAQEHQKKADFWYLKVGERPISQQKFQRAVDNFEHHQCRAREYRRMAARGEQVPEF